MRPTLGASLLSKLVLAVGTLCLGACVSVQQPERSVVDGRAAGAPVVAIVRASANEMSEAIATAFVERTDARVVVFTMRPGQSTKSLALGVRAQNASLVFALGADALVFAQKRLRDLPVLFAMVASAGDKIVRPAQVAGVGLELEPAGEFSMYRLLLPSMKAVVAFHRGAKPPAQLLQAREALAGIGIRLKTVSVSGIQQLEEDYAKAVADVDAVWLVPGLLQSGSFKLLRDRGLAMKKPLLCSALEHFVRDGALMAVTPDLANVAGQAAVMATEILSGRARPGELGVVAPVGGALVLNSAAATRLQVTIEDNVRFLVRTFYEHLTPKRPG